VQLTSSSNATLALKFHHSYRAVLEQAWGNINPLLWEPQNTWDYCHQVIQRQGCKTHRAAEQWAS